MKTTVKKKSNDALRTGLGRSRWPARLLSLTVLGAMAVQGQTIIQEFYLPMPEEQIYTVFDKHQTYLSPVDMMSVFSIVVTTPNTQITYDQWEGGYEADIDSPADATTQVWGDNNDANGICPGFVNDPDGLAAGTVITLSNRIPQTGPRNPADIYYDAGDRIGATKAITVARICYEPDGREAAQSVVVEVLSTLDHGLNYIAPVGIDDPASYNYMFYNADLMVMADEDNTAVEVDRDGPGPIVAFTTNINRGATGAFLVESISKGATVQADKPLQVHMVTGRFTGDYEARSYVLRPAELWSNKYIIPVGTMNTNYPSLVYLFNTNASPLTVNYTDQTESGSIVVPGGNGLASHTLALNSGTLLESVGGSPFFAICTMDTGLTVLSGAEYDWGFAPIPYGDLTTEAVCGWGPGAITNGSPGETGTENANPVWITAPSTTTLYVDFLGDKLGPLTDPNGDHYDTNFVVSALQAKAIYDPSRPDQTGMRIYTVDDTVIAGVWGEDASVAEAGPPYVDMGYALAPFPVVTIIKTSALVPELDTEPIGALNVGDTIEYTVRVTNRGALPLGNLLVLDTFAIQLTYVNNSTYFNGTPVPDDIPTPPFFFETPFPLDENPDLFGTGSRGVTITSLPRDGIADFVYRARIRSPGSIVNVGSAEEGPEPITSTNTISSVSTVSIGAEDVVVLEGDSGTTNLEFTVVLSDLRTDGDVLVEFFTSDGTNSPADAGIDYIPTNGMLRIPAGQTNATIIVKGIGDTDLELDETLFLTLTNVTFETADPEASGVVVGRDQGTGTIVNDDSQLFHQVDWMYNPRRDSWYGTLTLSNHTLSAESITTSVWYEVKSNAMHRLRFPDGPDPATGPDWYYLDVSSNFNAAVTSVGNGDLLLDPGESVVCCTIEDKTLELWGRGAVMDGGTNL